MDSQTATAALAALAQEHRLALFRLLVQAGTDGMSAGAIAAELGIPNSSLSFHLDQLRARLVQADFDAWDFFMARHCYLFNSRDDKFVS